jgi:transcriptional regulator with PAS, ATPase and Fis domain
MLNGDIKPLLEAIHKGICVFDKTGVIIAANSACLQLTGCASADLLGRQIDNFVPNLNPQHLCQAQDRVQVGMHLPAGKIMLAEFSPLIESGQILGGLLLLRDDDRVQGLREQLDRAQSTIEYLENKLTQKTEAGWYAGRMKSESSEDKLRSQLKPAKGFEKFIGMSPKVLAALTLAGKAAKVSSTVLIRGSSGTGKELVAEGIHQASPRAKGPFIRVNCAAIPENLLESEFFGHEKGAFTGAIKRKLGKFELANKGTIFLDEIGEMELSMQTKLLRVIQSGRFERVSGESTIDVDVRVLAATNRNMEQMIKEQLFREDLYYRLNVIPIYLPELKERREDIPLLVDFFLKKFSENFDKQLIGIKKTAMEILINYHWPGNVRELQNIMERIVVLLEGKYIEAEDVMVACNLQEPPAEEKLQLELPTENDVFPLADYEKQIIKVALEKYGSYTAAGKALGITHKTVAAKAQKYGIKK